MTTPSDDSYTIDAHAVAAESRAQSPIADAKLVEMLEPCPFCGGPAREPQAYNGTLETGCAGPHECPGTDVLVPIAAWNRRTPSPAQALRSVSGEALHFVFDAMPSPEGARFIEVENKEGRSVRAGEW